MSSTVQRLERVPPQNLEAEQGVLGSMLLDRDAIARAVEGLRADDFYRDAHRVIFQAMVELFERGEPVDLITVTNRLAVSGKLEDVGGPTYVASLPNVVPTAANVDFYANIVLEKSMLRALISAGTHIATMGYDGADDVAAMIDQAEKMVFGIASRRSVQDFEAIKEILKQSFEKIDRRYQEKGTLTGVATGFSDFDMLTSGLQAADMVVIAARPSVGKCVSADSEIVLEDGSVATIEEIYRRRQARLLTLDTDWKLRWTQPSAFVDDGIKQVYRMTTKLGRALECTATHPFRTLQGWIPLAALKVGDRIAVPRKIPVEGTKPMRECEIKILAYLIGDGALTGNKACFTNTNPLLIEDFASAVEEYGAVRARIKHGLWKKRAAQKEVPAAIFTLPQRQLALFLNRLYSTDGCATASAVSRNARIAYTTTSERLGRQLQHLLLRFGIISSLCRFSVRWKGAQRPYYHLNITDPGSIEIFACEIGIFGKEANLAKVLAMVRSKKRRHYPAGSIPRSVWRTIDAAREDEPLASLGRRAGLATAAKTQLLRTNLSRTKLQAIARALCHHYLTLLSKSEIYWDTIEAIEPVGAKQVYDLTIPETHNFVANNIVAHNTTLSLNIAQHAALESKIPVAIFSLETSKEQLVQRILCSEAQVDNSKLRTGFLADEDWRKLARAMGGLSEAPIFIDDSATMSIIEMRAKARKLKAEHGLGLIVIDYIQMIQSYKRAENRTQELSEIARGIKSLAKELDVPIIAVSQLSRAVEALGQKRPMLSHLRECVTGDTAVWDADTGRQYTIAELANASSWPRLLSLDRLGKLVRARPTAVFAKGDNDVFEVLTRTGRRLTATANHPLLTPTGWKAVKELGPDSSVGVARWPAAIDIESPTVIEAGRRTAGAMRPQVASRHSSVVALAERLETKQAAEMATNDVLWDKVVAITPNGPAPVYDLVMPGTHNFVANGLVAHNSGEIEQVSDLVVFLYREDYYDQEKAQKENKENICELIIAKHRNGPIGTVELYFHKEYSRFANLEKRRS